jgi:ubiquinone/menaquinone biosynthesis C-methylase UbiE
MYKKRTHAEREAVIRRKLVNNELNIYMDALLSIILLTLSPFIWMFAQLHDKIMFKFLNKTYIYNVSWEDPRMDQRVFDLSSSDHIITIASAGCNVLDYIIEGAEVTAVDFNLCQIALTELKKVAILNIEYEQFFEIFSKSNMDLLKELYPTKLRPHLSAPSAEFWDGGIHTIKSFMYSGTSGSMSFILFRIIFPLFGLGFVRRELAAGTSNEELLKKVSACEYSIRAVAWLMDNILLRGGCCLAGVPERQMALGLHRPNNLAQVIERVFFSTDLVNDNYFYAGYILGYYQKHNCPRYLEEQNYMKMRANLKLNKLHLVHGTMLDAIDNVKTPITIASLLDHMDWMTERMINEEITHLARKMSTKKALIFWRTFADDVHSAPLSWLNADRVDDHDDRVGMYWTTWLADIRSCDVAFEERIDTTQTKGLVADLITGAKIVTFPFWKPLVSPALKATGHAKDMESFYKYQKEGYDAFREGLLHARSDLIESLPLRKGGNMVWVDIGGGTARNLEFFEPAIIKKYFKKIVIVDISSSLLEIARQRIIDMGLEKIVTAIEADCTQESGLKGLPVAGTADIVTMSYSFSMIPDQGAAMVNATKLLKKDGHLAVADFFLDGKHDEALPRFARFWRKIERAFHKQWFAMDHVHLLGPEQLQLGGKQLEVIWDSRFRGAVPFFSFLKPYHGVIIFKKK